MSRPASAQARALAGWWSRARATVLGWLLALAVLPGAFAAPLQLDTGATTVQAWPAVTMLFEGDTVLTPEQALAQADRFTPTPTPHATLGLKKSAVWLRIPVELSAQAPARWILDIDYPALNRVDTWVHIDGRLVSHTVMGNQQPHAERPLASRALAMAIDLPPGGRAELLLRVQTTGALILPITLNTPRAFQSRALGEQMLQGVLTGLGLCLLVYSLGRWLALREPLSLKYALLITGSLMFSVFHFGIGAQYVWRDLPWMETRAAGLFSLMALTGSFLFIEQVLARPGDRRANAPRPRYAGPRFSRLMKIGAATTTMLIVALSLDLVGMVFISAFVTLVGPVPALLGLPGALARARRRDAVGWCFLVAWTIYAATTIVLILMINGRMPVNFWTQHAFQFGATLDMLLYMRVLGLGTKAVHTAAQHARKERDAMHSLAHSDPLTGLRNRRGLTGELKLALQKSSPTQLVSLYLLDLDGFKPVNDQHGHDVGDELLVAVARRLQATVRSGDVVARLGGDEFVIMSSGLAQPAQADALAHKLLDAIKEPFEIGEHTHRISLTVGYALAPLDGTGANELLKRADTAMFAGKQAGKGVARRALSSA